MIPGESPLEKELPQEVFRVGQGIPDLGKKGGPLGRVFDEEPMDPRLEEAQKFPAALNLEGDR